LSWKYNVFTDELDYDGVPEHLAAADHTHAFPVGSLYFNITGIDPLIELGYGTWTQVAQGQFLIGHG